MLTCREFAMMKGMLCTTSILSPMPVLLATYAVLIGKGGKSSLIASGDLVLFCEVCITAEMVERVWGSGKR